MSRRILGAMVIGLCVVLVIGGIIGGGCCYSRANNGGHDGNEMDTFGTYSGVCFDAAIPGGLAALSFALRKRSSWPSARGLFVSGGLLMLIVVGPIPGLQLGQTLENDAQGFLAIASFGCVLLASVGATMVVASVAKALGNTKGGKNGQGK